MKYNLSNQLDFAEFDYNAEYFINWNSINHDLCIKLPAYIVNIRYSKLFERVDLSGFFSTLRQTVIYDYSANYIVKDQKGEQWLTERTDALRKLDDMVFSPNAQMAKNNVIKHVKECIRVFIEADKLPKGADESLKDPFDQKIRIKHSFLDKSIETIYKQIVGESEVEYFSFFKIGKGNQDTLLSREEDAEILYMILLMYLLERKLWFTRAFNNVLLPYYPTKSEELGYADRLRLEKWQAMEFQLFLPVQTVQDTMDMAPNDLPGEKSPEELIQELTQQWEQTKSEINHRSAEINENFNKIIEKLEDSSVKNQLTEIETKLTKIDEELTKTDPYKWKSDFLRGSFWESKKRKQNTTKHFANTTAGILGVLGMELGKTWNSDTKVKPDLDKASKEIFAICAIGVFNLAAGPVFGSFFGGIVSGLIIEKKDSPELEAINNLRSHLDDRLDKIDTSLEAINNNLIDIYNSIVNLGNRMDARFDRFELISQQNFNKVFSKLDAIIHLLEYESENKAIKKKFDLIESMQDKLLIKIKNAESSIIVDLKKGNVMNSYLIGQDGEQRIYSPYDLEEIFFVQYSNILKEFYDLEFDIRNKEYDFPDKPSKDSLCDLLRKSGTIYFLEAFTMIQKVTTKLRQICTLYYNLRKSYSLVYFLKMSFSNEIDEKSKSELMTELMKIAEGTESIYRAFVSESVIKQKMLSPEEIVLFNEVFYHQTNSFFYGGYTLALQQEDKLLNIVYDETQKRLVVNPASRNVEFEKYVFYPVHENQDSNNIHLRFWEDPDRDIVFESYVYFGHEKGQVIVEPKAHAKEKRSYILQKQLGDNEDTFLKQLEVAYNDQKSIPFDQVKFTPFNPKPAILQSNEDPENGMILEFFPYTMVVLKKFFNASGNAKSDLFVRLLKEEAAENHEKTYIIFHGEKVSNEYARLDVDDLIFE